MSEQSEPKVGQRVRSLRDQQGYSLRALAEKCGLSITSISQIERGENSPTVSTLHRLALALNVPITEFFTEEDRQTAVFVKRGLGLSSRRNGVVLESLGIGLFNQQLEPFRVKIAPGRECFLGSVSHSGEEFVHCLEGEIEYQVGERQFNLERGDSLLFDATQPHGYSNPYDSTAEMLLVFQTSQEGQHVRRIHLSG